MYAWFPAKAKVNRRGRGNCAVVRATDAKTMQAQGEECGYFHAPLRRRHACRVAKLDRCHGVSAGHSNQRAVSQCNPVAVSQSDVVSRIPERNLSDSLNRVFAVTRCVRHQSSTVDFRSAPAISKANSHRYATPPSRPVSVPINSRRRTASSRSAASRSAVATSTPEAIKSKGRCSTGMSRNGVSRVGSVRSALQKQQQPRSAIDDVRPDSGLIEYLQPLSFS